MLHGVWFGSGVSEYVCHPVESGLAQWPTALATVSALVRHLVGRSSFVPGASSRKGAMGQTVTHHEGRAPRERSVFDGIRCFQSRSVL